MVTDSIGKSKFGFPTELQSPFGDLYLLNIVLKNKKVCVKNISNKMKVSIPIGKINCIKLDKLKTALDTLFVIVSRNLTSINFYCYCFLTLPLPKMIKSGARAVF